MALARQLTIAPSTKVDVIAALAESTDTWIGNSFLLFNSGTVTVEVGGTDIDTQPGFRGLTAGATMGIDTDPNDALTLYVRGGSTSGTVDVVRVK